MTVMMLDDLCVEEILCRVPAISLKRLRSTCKQWNNLFSNSRFTRMHLEKAAKQFLVLMLKNGRVCSMSVKLHGTKPYVMATCERSLIDPRSLVQEQIGISHVYHCDGLLLCTENNYIIVVWNPLTGQTKWIEPRNGDKKTNDCYALGSYQDKKSGNKSYKILSYGYNHQEFEIYDINSNSWRTLDATPNCHLVCGESGASLKGKTYWIASQGKEKHPGIFLVSFDYTREKFERLTGQIPIAMDDQNVALSVVREEKLAVLLKPEYTTKVEVWLTNKIDESTKAISWSKVFALDLSPHLEYSHYISFLLDEEKKVLVFCDHSSCKNKVYIVGEDNRVTRMCLGDDDAWPFLFSYVPSLTQIQQDPQISSIIRDYPRLLILDAEKSLAPKLQVLSRGASSSELTETVSKVPKILAMKGDKTISRYYDFVKEIIEAGKSSKFEKRLLFPLLVSDRKLVCGREKFEESLKKVVEMGFDLTTAEFVEALRAVQGISGKRSALLKQSTTLSISAGTQNDESVTCKFGNFEIYLELIQFDALWLVI
ncbi:PREDICTED: probable F-box protein At5g47300 [Camelina sativa]|uniref:Probable F-box protein At5g47300 n=1 Tax=Camelina sativa TaxID=90675 RepID=A0ABM0TUJ7_CAMSA|nr:PREDICTED: probable F-box protein At5g47300 [Camelina sativa]